MTGDALLTLLGRHRFDTFTGVPCSLVEGLVAALEDDPARGYVAAVREDVAVGVAAGAGLGGRRPVVVMQNSGLGTSLNALASLSLMYGLPALLLVTWRGFQGKDAPEHLLMGQISRGLLDLLGIPHRIPSAESLEDDLAWAAREMEAQCRPVALLLRPGLVTRQEGRRPAAPPASPTATGAGPVTAGGRPSVLRPRISRLDAFRAALAVLGDEPAIHANGYLSREACAVADRPQNFYMIGSMGLAAAIGLGVALARPTRHTVVFDGDGNLLMSLGTLALVAAVAPANLVHLVLDNEVYGSTGNQRSISGAVRLDALARAAGYRGVAAVTEPEAIAGTVREMLATEGPHFLLVKVTPEQADVPRIPHAPEAIRDRFRSSLGRP